MENIYNAEDLGIVIPMYNLLQYSDCFSMTLGRLRSYYRDEVDNVNVNASDGKWFKDKTKITGKIEARPAQRGNDSGAD